MGRYDHYTDKFLRDTQYGILSTNLAEVGTDCISRQQAIDAMAELQGRASTKAELTGISKAWKRIKQLPPAQPAQPEIIRCKDCLMHGVCRFEQGLGLDGYCSQAERRIDG